MHGFAFFDHIISKEEIFIVPQKIKSTLEWPTPKKNYRGVQVFGFSKLL